MFSPDVQTDVRQTIAMQQFTSIEDICAELNREANKQNFLREPVEINEEKANGFVEVFAYQNGMQTSTVQPFIWSFSIDGQKLFDDGVIELHTEENKYFAYTKVDKSKITQSSEKSVSSDTDNLYAHQAWLKKLGQQVTEWEQDLKSFADNERTELGIKLKVLDSLLNTVKTNTKNVSKDAIIEIERQWNSFQDSIDKIKKSMQRSSQ